MRSAIQPGPSTAKGLSSSSRRLYPTTSLRRSYAINGHLYPLISGSNEYATIKVFEGHGSCLIR
jgi:hypothetical protein